MSLVDLLDTREVRAQSRVKEDEGVGARTRRWLVLVHCERRVPCGLTEGSHLLFSSQGAVLSQDAVLGLEAGQHFRRIRKICKFSVEVGLSHRGQQAFII